MHINIAEPTVQLKMKLMMLNFISIYLQVHAPKKEPTIVVCRKILVAFFSLFRLHFDQFWCTICFFIDNLLLLVYFRAIYRHSTKVNQSLIRFSQFSSQEKLKKNYHCEPNCLWLCHQCEITVYDQNIVNGTFLIIGHDFYEFDPSCRCYFATTDITAASSKQKHIIRF